MRISKRMFEVYKWLPFCLMVNWFTEVYHHVTHSAFVLINLGVFFLIIIPFIFMHSMIIRHIYTKCQNKEGGFYEL